MIVSIKTEKDVVRLEKLKHIIEKPARSRCKKKITEKECLKKTTTQSKPKAISFRFCVYIVKGED